MHAQIIQRIFAMRSAQWKAILSMHNLHMCQDGFCTNQNSQAVMVCHKLNRTEQKRHHGSDFALRMLLFCFRYSTFLIGNFPFSDETSPSCALLGGLHPTMILMECLSISWKSRVYISTVFDPHWKHSPFVSSFTEKILSQPIIRQFGVITSLS